MSHKRLAVFQKFLLNFVLALSKESFQEFFSFQVSPRAAQLCVAGNILPASYEIRDRVCIKELWSNGTSFVL